MKNPVLVFLSLILFSCKSQPAYQSQASSIVIFTNCYMDTLDGYLYGNASIGGDEIYCVLGTDIGFTGDSSKCDFTEMFLLDAHTRVPRVRINGELMPNVCVNNTRNLMPYSMQKINKGDTSFYLISFEFVSHIGRSGWEYYVIKMDKSGISSFCHSSEKYLLVDGVLPAFIEK